jgi:hypothetical protein
MAFAPGQSPSFETKNQAPAVARFRRQLAFKEERGVALYRAFDRSVELIVQQR